MLKETSTKFFLTSLQVSKNNDDATILLSHLIETKQLPCCKQTSQHISKMRFNPYNGRKHKFPCWMQLSGKMRFVLLCLMMLSLQGSCSHLFGKTSVRTAADGPSCHFKSLHLACHVLKSEILSQHTTGRTKWMALVELSRYPKKPSLTIHFCSAIQ